MAVPRYGSIFTTANVGGIARLAIKVRSVVLHECTWPRKSANTWKQDRPRQTLTLVAFLSVRVSLGATVLTPGHLCHARCTKAPLFLHPDRTITPSANVWPFLDKPQASMLSSTEFGRSSLGLTREQRRSCRSSLCGYN